MGDPFPNTVLIMELMDGDHHRISGHNPKPFLVTSRGVPKPGDATWSPQGSEILLDVIGWHF